ncbi:hypothetical protein PSAB_05220 [Paenibacillus sabinae T27]|uniref:Putative pyruvate, phosphate dikinase regulatory protein n=2 Tax=Paenibacillus sabinae TaxID=365617 RepID=X4ZGX4_9BACL|nr:hypothetical protein PSAB_05220 [Paenibacillus sabinae T27]
MDNRSSRSMTDTEWEEAEHGRWIVICSDAVGETAEAVVSAALRQFEARPARIKRFSHIAGGREIREAVREAAERRTFVAYTFAQPELTEMMIGEAAAHGVSAVDIMGPVISAISGTFHNPPLARSGLEGRLNEAYFRRVEAMEFAVKYDDGRDSRGIGLAEIVLIGVSRTSKTPLSIYLAHKGYKVANYPLTPEVQAPPELFQIPSRRIFGLTMELESILKIRTERLRSLGLQADADYAAAHRVVEEFTYAEELMRRIGCKVIDVSDKSIEETAGLIIDFIR